VITHQNPDVTVSSVRHAVIAANAIAATHVITVTNPAVPAIFARTAAGVADRDAALIVSATNPLAEQVSAENAVSATDAAHAGVVTNPHVPE